MSKTTPVNVETKETGEAQVEIKVIIPWNEVQKRRGKALDSLSNEVSIDGFRKGHIPEKVLVQHVGEMSILREAAYHTLNALYPTIIEESGKQLIGEPHVAITKLAPENDLEATITSAILPTVELPDYKKIAQKIRGNKKPITVEEKDMEEGINHILEQWARHEKYEKTLKDTPEEERKNVHPSEITVEKAEYPELTDEFVQKIGDFKTVDEFKEKFKENLKQEKELRENDRVRGEILDTIAKEAKFSIPEVVVDSELKKMTAQFEDEVRRVGLDMEEYLKQIKKTREDVENEWRPDARKRAERQLVLNAIAREEKISPDEEVLAQEIESLKKQYPTVNDLDARIYVATLLTNRKVMEFLEGESSKKEKEVPNEKTN